MKETLPIYDTEQKIVDGLRQSRRLVLQAPTGSGKSTQVPQMLLKHGFLSEGRAVILQPRRLAARLLATRVAHELGTPLGNQVGYQVRFENVTSPATQIKFETEGILLRQLIQDPSLSGIAALIFDEFHERHLYGDITLARALEIQEQRRPDLLLIVMSATLDTGLLESYLSPCSVVSSAGRTFPVTVDYLAQRVGATGPRVWDLAADAFSANPPSGDVLIFMPGGYEIQRTVESLRRKPEARGRLLLPLYGELPPRDQDAAVARYDQPKVVVATNVAETSITIEGVSLVIDSGLARVPGYDPNRGINTLLVERISQASAEQRTGRAGRTSAGRCIRLWSRAEHDERAVRNVPEIQRLDLAEVVLTLKASGIRNLKEFRWLEKPNEAALAHAEELLLDLGALSPVSDPGSSTAITDLGRSMLAFPVHPRYARMLLAAEGFGCVYQACLVAALTQGRDLLLRNTSRAVSTLREELFGLRDREATSDLIVLARAWEYASRVQFRMEAMQAAGIHGATARQVGPLHEQFLRIAGQENLDVSASPIDDVALRKCILIGFSDRVARRIDEGQSRCELVHGRRGVLSKETAVRDSSLVVAAEIQELSGKPGEVNTILSLITAVELDWLTEFFPSDLREETRVSFDTVAMRVRADQALTFRDLVVALRKVDPPRADAARLLAEEVVSGRLKLAKWDHAVEQWILRLNQLAAWCPDFGLSPIRDEDRGHIIEQICFGATSFKEIRDREVRPVVKSWVSAPQQELIEKHAPERALLSNGRTPKVTYETGTPPYISLRIQELFGVTQTPRIAAGRVPLSVHILAPSMRPVQVTQDLANFWKEHYPRIKSELQRRYPKHEWR